MRIAIVWPWFRTLGHLYGRELEKLGHEVLLVTSERHFAGGQYGQVDEVIATQVGFIKSIKSIWSARSKLKAFNPDVIIVEDVYSHPIWWAARLFGVPLIGSIHDPMPHDENHTRKGLRKLVSSIQNFGMDATIYYSESALKEAEELGIRRNKPAYVWPLISEMPDDLVTQNAQIRRGFAMIGRWSHYKGFDIGMQAWQALPDEVRKANPLEVWQRIGSSTPPFTDPCLVWHSDGFEWQEISEMLSRIKYVLLPYRSASQSGVQVLAQQCGARVIYTDLSGLAEFAVAGDIAVAGTEVELWREAMLVSTTEPAYDSELITFESRGFADKLAKSIQDMGSLVHGKSV